MQAFDLRESKPGGPTVGLGNVTVAGYAGVNTSVSAGFGTGSRKRARMDFAFGTRLKRLEQDPDFLDYIADLDHYEQLRTTVRLKNRPTSPTTISWIEQELRHIPIDARTIARKYATPAVAVDMTDVDAIYSAYKDLVEYEDRIALRDLMRRQTTLRVNKTRYIQQWVLMEANLKALSENPYAIRMDPTSHVEYTRNVNGDIQRTLYYDPIATQKRYQALVANLL
jgi:hypothetical protein